MRSHFRGIALLLPLAVLVFSPGVLGREERPAPPPHEIPEHLAHRTKRTHLGAEGGNAKTESAVRAGLDWLARHQSERGYWDADGFTGRCEGDECAGEGYALYDPGVTGLALLAFLADGQTYKSGDHRSVVMNAVKYLKMIQGPEGCFGPRSAREFVYNHAIATLAWVEVYPAKNSASLTALGMLSRLLLAKNVKQEKATLRMKLGKTLCLSLPPRWETPHLDMYYEETLSILQHIAISILTARAFSSATTMSP